MYILYNLVLTISLIFLSPVLLLILLSGKKFRAGFFQKAGFLPELLKEKCNNLSSRPVWFHAVSVGETIAVAELVKKFCAENPELPVFFSTVTATGQQIALKRLGDIVTVFYFPYDIGYITSKVINIVNPQLVVIVETEIWPNFAYNLHKRNIPLVLINGRISPKSFNNYRKVAFFTTHILRFFSYFLMQSEIDATRIMQMGAEEAKVEIAGNLKYDIKPDLTPEDIIELKEKLCIKESDNIVIAGSTHNGEESIILDTFLHLKENLPNLKLIMVPRHPERYDEVIKVFKLKEVSFCRRSQKETFDKASIMLLDTMGELSTFYAIADVAFVGGSIIEKGGHNPLEPAVYSVPVVVGPHTFNFLDITKYMVQAGGAIQVQSKDDLYSVFFDLLTDQATYARAQKACSLLFEKNRGATDKTLHCLYQYL